MKKLLTLLSTLFLLVPFTASASIAVPWLATSTDPGYIQPNPVNGNNPFLKILSISTSTFQNGINLTTGCFSIAGVCITGSGGGSGTVTNIATTYPILGGPITTTGTISFAATSTPTVTAPITYSGVLGSFIGGVSGTFDCISATGSVKGCLTASDWTTFNNKQPAGNYITALTGDVTASGPGSVAATLATVNGNVGSFTNANITVNAKGLITAVSNGASGSGGAIGTSTPLVNGQVDFSTSANTIANDSSFLFDSVLKKLTTTNASTTNLSIGALSGILKQAGGVVVAATPGTDYENPLTFVYPLVRAVNSISTAFGTTTSNTWAGTQTFTNPIVIGSLTGTLNTNSGIVYATGTSTPTVSAPITYSGTLGQFISGVSGAFGCTNASSGVTGCLTGTDWNTFNNKQATISVTAPLRLTGTTIDWTGLATTSQPSSSNLLTSNGGAGVYGTATSTLTASSPLTGSFTQIGSGGSLGCQTASGSQAGCLSATDWTTFNNKGSGTVTSITLGGGLDGVSPITTTGTITAQIGTSTVPLQGGLAYWTGIGTPSTLGTVATGTVSNGTGISVTAGQSVIGSGLTITNTSPLSGLTTSFPLSFSNPTLSWIGLATTSQPSSSNILVSDGVKGIYGAATTTASCSGTVSCSTFNILGSSPVTITGSGSGGTGLSTSSPLANSNVLTYSTAGAGSAYGTATTSVSNGTGISFTGTAGALLGGSNLTITNTGVTSIVAGTGISVSGATGAVTISNTNGYPFTPSTDNSINTSATSTPIEGTHPGLGLDVANTSWYGIGGVNVLYASSTNFDTTGGFLSNTNATTLANPAYNTSFGYQALASNTTGASSTAIGYKALFLNTTGSDNTSVGLLANSGNVSGSNNVSVGYGALNVNTVSNNTAIGSVSLVANSSGANNSALGFSSLQANTTGSDNAAFGYQVMDLNTTGSGNAAFGEKALFGNTTGTDNTAIGWKAGDVGTGVYFRDTFIGGSTNLSPSVGILDTTELGYEAGFRNTGWDGTFLGEFSGQNITSGNNNIVIGFNALAPSATTDNQLNIGNFIFGSNLPATTSATTLSLPTTGTLGIGSSSPYAKLSVMANNGDTNTTLFAVGSSTATATSTLFNILNTGNVGIGTTSPYAELSLNAPAQSTPYFAIGSTTSQVFSIAPSAAAQLAVATGTPLGTNALTVNGGVYLHGVATGAGAGTICSTADGQLLYNSGAACVVSSLRFKNVDATITPQDSLDTVNKLSPIYFHYKQGYGDSGKQQWEGFGAEDVALVDKDLVQYDASSTPYSVYYQNITAKLVGAVQALSQHQSEQDQQIAQLQQEVAELKNHQQTFSCLVP